MLIQYIRNLETRQPYGTVVADKDGKGGIKYGYSICNLHKGDHFSKAMGIKIAEGRMNCNRPQKIPPQVAEVLPYFLAKAQKYFYKNVAVAESK